MCTGVLIECIPVYHTRVCICMRASGSAPVAFLYIEMSEQYEPESAMCCRTYNCTVTSSSILRMG